MIKNKAYSSFLWALLIGFFILITACTSEPVKVTTKGATARFTLLLPKDMKEITDKEMRNSDAILQYGNLLRETYVMVVEEEKDSVHEAFRQYEDPTMFSTDLEGYCKLITQTYKNNTYLNLKKVVFNKYKLKNFESRVMEAEGSFDGNGILYKVVLISGKRSYYQLAVWTLADRKEKLMPELDAVLQSFDEQ